MKELGIYVASVACPVTASYAENASGWWQPRGLQKMGVAWVGLVQSVGPASVTCSTTVGVPAGSLVRDSASDHSPMSEQGQVLECFR